MSLAQLQHIAGVIAGIGLILWLPLTFFIGALLFSEMKPEERKSRYWAFPFLIRRYQLDTYGQYILPLYRVLFFGWIAFFAAGMFWGFFLQPIID